jgi:8-oxo-dGTP pyrophosphatase MutT (NUDIX family)
MFNAIDPFSPSYYKAESWFVIGKRIHSSRLLTFISRPMPDILKPAYNFGGISLSQLIEPYVNRWLKTVDSVNRLISNFSIRGIKTNLIAMLAEGSAQGIIDRVETFNRLSDNRGTMMLDKETEDFFLNNVPLRGLDLLQAQAQEHMAAPTHIPLVKLTGVSPTGLNATSDGEITVFYDWIKSEQLNLFSEHMKTILDLLQLNLWGKIVPEIGFEWVPLDTPDEMQLATIDMQKGTTGQALLSSGVITEDEERARIQKQAGSGYGALAGKAPGKPKPEPVAGVPGAKKPIAKDSDIPEAAGVCFVDENEKILLMHRTDGEGWAFPAGGAEGGESPDMTARREASEETGWSGEESLALADMTQTPTLRFYTFKTHVKQFTPILNSEHDKARWFSPKQALLTPLSLHPGVRNFLLRWKGGHE